MAIELECKLAIPSREAIAARLRALSAQAEDDRMERNWTFDTETHSLRERGMLLRLRAYEGEARGIVTLKRPLASSEYSEASSSQVKCREEIELEVDRPDAFAELAEALGYHLDWYYEKRRQIFYYRDCTIALDELPGLGCFLEVEGKSREAIHAVLQELGLHPEAHIEGTYRCLYEEKYGRSERGTPGIWTFERRTDLPIPTR